MCLIFFIFLFCWKIYKLGNIGGLFNYTFKSMIMCLIFDLRSLLLKYNVVKELFKYLFKFRIGNFLKVIGLCLEDSSIK